MPFLTHESMSCCAMKRQRMRGTKRVRGIAIVAAILVVGGAPLCHAGGNDKDQVTPSLEPTRGPLHEHMPAQLSLRVPPPTSPISSPTAPPPSTQAAAHSTSPPSSQATGPLPTTSSDSELLVQRLEAFNVVMTMEGVILPLNEASKQVFTTVTRDSIARSIVEVLGSNQIQDLQVQVSLDSHSSKRRLLRSKDYGLRAEDETISFNVLILIRSVIQTHDLSRYVASTFNDHLDIFIYVNTLKASGDTAFSNITTVSIARPILGSSSANEDDTMTGTRNKRETSYLIAAVMAGLVASLAGIGLVACFVQYRRQRQRQELKRIKRNKTFLSSYDFAAEIASEIEIGGCTDMSSLGDPSLISQYGGLSIIDTVVHDGEIVCGACLVDEEDDEENVSVTDGPILSDSQSVQSAPLPMTKESSTLSLAGDGFVFSDSNSLPLPAEEMDYDLEVIDGVCPSLTATDTSSANAESVTHESIKNPHMSSFEVFQSIDEDGHVVEYWYA